MGKNGFNWCPGPGATPVMFCHLEQSLMSSSLLYVISRAYPVLTTAQ